VHYFRYFLLLCVQIFLFSHKKWEIRYGFMARIASIIRNLSQRKHYDNLLCFQSQKPIKVWPEFDQKAVWKHFSKIKSDTVKCNKCEKVLKESATS
jgi:hypothetical protein